jgi:hypothetical protein
MNPMRAASIALLGCALALELSCRDAGPLGVAAPPAPPAVLNFTGSTVHPKLLRCTPMRADTETETVGPNGGVIHVGPHALSIPAGALRWRVRITAIAPSDTVNRIVFAPEGLDFREAPLLTMSYANCRPRSFDDKPKRIAFTTDRLFILELLRSNDKPFAHTVSARIDHFSIYAVAW